MERRLRDEREEKKYKKLIKSIFNYVCGFGLIVRKIQNSFVSFATIKNIFVHFLAYWILWLHLHYEYRN